MARYLKETTEIAMDPLVNVIMAMVLFAICVLMGRKVIAGRVRGKKNGEGTSRGGGATKQKREKAVGNDSQSELDSGSSEELHPSPGDIQRKKK